MNNAISRIKPQFNNFVRKIKLHFNRIVKTVENKFQDNFVSLLSMRRW